MSKLLVMPKLNGLVLPQGVSFEISPAALARWNAALAAKETDEEEENTITIYDAIGSDPFFGGGTTAKRIAGALRGMKKKNVVVNINSPGGDFFEGIAIYNLLRDHDGEVTTRVIGLAASAASVIAMAGANIQVARAGFMMIHNVWVLAVGNRHDLRDAFDQLEAFDDALTGVYAARTGKDKKEIGKLMDKETWFSGEQAIEGGFADALLPADEVEENDGEKAAAMAGVRGIDMELAQLGMPRARRRALINRMKESFGTQDAAEQQDRGTHDADPKATHDAGAVEAKASEMADRFLRAPTT